MVEVKLDELRDCHARLLEVRADFEAILTMLGTGTYLTGERKVRAQESLRNLKERLKRDYRKGTKDLTEAERLFYFPSVHKALSSIHVAYNSRPDNRWIDELYDGRSSIDGYIDQIESSIKEGKA